MKVTRQSSTTADAVQWLGTSQSLQEIQALLAPASPLYDGDFDQQIQYRSLGVMVSTAHVPSGPMLQHLSPTGWVVKDGDTITIMTDDQFRRSYTQELPDEPDLGGAIVGTHPRLQELTADLSPEAKAILARDF